MTRKRGIRGGFQPVIRLLKGMKMNCQEIRSRLAGYAEGRLSPDEREHVRAHLLGCASCRTALTHVDKVAAVLMYAENPPVPAGLTIRVMAAARSRQRVAATVCWNPLQWWRMAAAPMHAAAAVVLVAGLTVGLLLGWTSAPLIAQTTTVAQQDPLDAYRLDYLGDVPAGSLADSYLALVVATNEGGR